MLINSFYYQSKRCILCGHLIVFLTFFIFEGASAQEILSACGDYLKTPNGTVSFTIGEPINETYSGSNKILTQGFQQSNIIITLINEATGLNYNISVFPNPANNFFKIILENNTLEGFYYSLFDINGKLIEQDELTDFTTTISMVNYKPATYLLYIYNNSEKVFNYKIVKTK